MNMHQMFSVYTSPEECKNAAFTSHFGFVFELNSFRKSHVIVTPLLLKSTVFNMFYIPPV